MSLTPSFARPLAVLLLGLALPATALAEDAAGAAETIPGAETSTQRPPTATGARRVTLDYVDVSVWDLIQFFARITGRNFILGETREYQEKVTLISHDSITVNQAWEGFVQALDQAGYAVVQVGQGYRVMKVPEAGKSPIRVHTGDEVPYTANYVTQIIPVENASVSDLQAVVTALAGPNATVVAYQPNNTFMITDSAHNIRRVHQVIRQFDVAAPRSRMEIIPIVHADASDIKAVIEELYGTGERQEAAPAATARRPTPRRAPRRPRRDEPEPAAAEGVTAGSESNYISKVLADERTNSLIVLANDQGMTAVKELVAQLDVDVDLSARSQIHVVYLEHARAEDVARVLANLSEGGGGTTARGSAAQGARTPAQQAAAAARARAQQQQEEASSPGVTAAFDSGMRITHDETTNALVIIASQDDYRVVRQVIDQLDIRRRQVYIDAVILEITSRDELGVSVGWHGPFNPGGGEDTFGILGGQLGASSVFGLTQDLLSGLAMGVFGPSIEVPISGPTGPTTIQVPAFGIVLQALRTNSAVNIVSNPQLLTLDNEEAKIVVGRKVPFPTAASFNNLGQPVVSFQREDVATTLRLTPRVNSANHVTMEVIIEVAEVEEDSRGLDVAQAGFITSKREVETTVLVRDNQTVVLGGLVGMTDSRIETKVPILGDLPLVGVLFRGSRSQSSKSNLMVFLTPHIIDDEDDMLEVMRVKEAQRQEFIRRFYGKSREQQLEEIRRLLDYSMNRIDQPSMFRGPVSVNERQAEEGRRPISDESREVLDEELAIPHGGEVDEPELDPSDEIEVPLDEEAPTEEVP